MSTRQHASEEELAGLACAHLRATPRARVLIGGLGFGFTLRAALKVLQGDAAVVVAEILPAVIAWNRDPALPLAADCLADPRVTLVERDVGEVIRQARGSFDAIVLDVDNGPSALSAAGNTGLYSLAGLRHARAALRPPGCVAFWSAAPDPAFASLMTQAGFIVEQRRARSRAGAGRRHTVFLGRGK
jgi:spermidine synthase